LPTEPSESLGFGAVMLIVFGGLFGCGLCVYLCLYVCNARVNASTLNKRKLAVGLPITASMEELNRLEFIARRKRLGLPLDANMVMVRVKEMEKEMGGFGRMPDECARLAASSKPGDRTKANNMCDAADLRDNLGLPRNASAAAVYKAQEANREANRKWMEEGEGTGIIEEEEGYEGGF